MKIAAIVAIAAFIFQQSSCDQSTKSTEKQRRYPPIHRFENASSAGVTGVALDTVTGQLCKTWEWAYKSDAQSGDWIHYQHASAFINALHL